MLKNAFILHRLSLINEVRIYSAGHKTLPFLLCTLVANFGVFLFPIFCAVVVTAYTSSTIKRFTEHPNISQHIKLNEKDVERTPYHKIHRLVLDYYRSLIPKYKQYYLGHFSLKKNAGLYGLIFGSGHVLGIEKFLNTCWNLDKERGEANFDIDEDNINPGQFDLFTGQVKKPKKIELYEKDLTNKIINGKLINDKDVYLFNIENGFPTKKTKQILKSLVIGKKIANGNFDISSKVCKPNSNITKIKVL